LVIADGPRSDRPDDARKCEAARAVVERVDWDCDVLRNYSDVNLGCGRRPATGISWVFDQVEEAVILEDDCLPHPTFFRFCDDLLSRYRDDEGVMHISATTFRFYKNRGTESYFFSFHPLSWGWATWRRAWRHFDQEVKRWPSLRSTSLLQDILMDHRVVADWQRKLDRAYACGGDIDYWDYQWTFACWRKKGLSILPHRNLLLNIGLGHPDAIHTKMADDRQAFQRAEEMSFPLKHPISARRLLEADRSFIEQIVVPKLDPPNRFHDRLHRRWSHIIGQHPSLRSPRAFCRRVCQKFLSSFGLYDR
jgi:hypothetical protein